MQIHDAADFYVTRLVHFVSATESWLVLTGSPSRCVGVHTEVVKAIEQATRIAEYRVSRGAAAQVHVRHADNAPWRTVWCPPDVMPRFP